MLLNRRIFLLGGAATLAVRANAAFAIEPLTVVAIVSAAAKVASDTLNFAKRSGDFELELNAIHAKLDQVLRNQLAILEAVSDLAVDVKRILEKINRLPSEVLAAQYLSDSASLCSTVADALDHGTKAEVATRVSGPNGAYELSTKIAHGASYSPPSPNIALAAQNVLNAVEAIVKHSDRKTLKDTRAKLVDTTTYVRNALERMTTASGIRANMPNPGEFRRAITGLRDKNRIQMLLADAFDATELSNEEAVRSVCTLSPAGEQVRSGPSTKCKTVGRLEYASESCSSFMRVDVLTAVTRSKFFVRRKKIYGGKSLYEVGPIGSEQWERATWVKRVTRFRVENDPWTEDPVSSDDPKKIAGCRPTTIDETGLAPGEFSDFLNQVALYDSYVAEEGRLLAIQDVALADLDRCKRLSSKLRV
ncbi:hypothetical protein ES707_00808 [subsurface metagenome]|jgi:hypothetical protein